MLLTIGSVATMVGWFGLLAYGVAWLAKYRARPDDSRDLRATWMLGVVVLLGAGAALRWLGADQFPSSILANLAVAAFCGITWAELAGHIKSRG